MTEAQGVDQDRCLLAGILFKSKVPVNGLLEEVVRTLHKRGLNLAGVLQVAVPSPGDTKDDAILVGLRGDWKVSIFQDRGKLGSGCRLDPQAITDVAGRLSADLKSGADLLVVNRFGQAESEGYGLRQVLEEAAAAEIPVLLAVREDYAEAWEEFHGGLGEFLPPDSQAILDWCTAVCGEKAAAE